MSSNRIDTLIYTLRQNDHLVSHISTTRFSRNFLSCFPSTFLTISREPVYFPCTLSHFSIVRDFLELSLGASFSRNFQVSSLLSRHFQGSFVLAATAEMHVQRSTFARTVSGFFQFSFSQLFTFSNQLVSTFVSVRFLGLFRVCKFFRELRSFTLRPNSKQRHFIFSLYSVFVIRYSPFSFLFYDKTLSRLFIEINANV